METWVHDCFSLLQNTWEEDHSKKKTKNQTQTVHLHVHFYLQYNLKGFLSLHKIKSIVLVKQSFNIYLYSLSGQFAVNENFSLNINNVFMNNPYLQYWRTILILI